MRSGRLTALTVAAALTAGSFGATAWMAGREEAPLLPVRLKHGTVYMTRSVPESDTTNRQGAARSLYLLQFTGPVRPAYKQAVVSRGAELGDYLPENAFIARMSASQAKKVAELPYVRGVAVYQPEQKIDRSLRGSVGSTQQRVRVTTFTPSTKAVVEQLSTLGARPLSFGHGTLEAEVTASSLGQLASSADVVYVEPIRKNQLFNDNAGAVMGVPPVWAKGLDGKGQIVAVSDTGLDTGKNDQSLHPDFQGRVKSIFALGKPGDASDTLAHGTHVAGSVLGTGAASDGKYKGTAPGAQLVFQSVEDGQGGLGGIPSDLSQLFRQAYGAGARIHTNSWGVPAASGGAVYDGQSAAVDRFIWENPDYTILFAAGNDGDHDRDNKTNYGTISTPGTAKNAITVGASQNDRPDRKQGTDIQAMASFSSRGPTSDNRIKPDLVAPGTWIVSARAAKAKDNQFWAPHETNKRYGYMGGTSMATPLTAGATALVRQFYVEKLGVTPKASLLKATLINGAAPMGSSLTWKDTGWGRVDVDGTLQKRPFKFVNEEKGLQTAESVTYSYNVQSGNPLKVTLVWTDYPANPAAEKSLVNDLDLVVTGPDGKPVAGNVMIGAAPDRTNNVENVEIKAPGDGAYKVTVKAHNVPQGPQRFSLVVSGLVAGGVTDPTPPPADPAPKPPADTQAPSVSLTGPAAGSRVSGTVHVSAEASDNVGVSRVLFYVDGALAGEVTTAPFTWSWKTDSVPDGEHTLVANAYDAAGNVGKSAPVRVTVTNQNLGRRVDLQFTGKASAFGIPQRYFVDVRAGSEVSAAISSTVAGGVSLVAFDPNGRYVAQGRTKLTFNAAETGTYSVTVLSYSPWAEYAVAVSLTPADWVGQFAQSGTLSSAGQRFAVYTVQVSRKGALSAFVTAAERRADLDLYLVDSQGRIVAVAQSPNLNPETLSAQVSAGTYRIYVVADSGRTDFQLNLLYPKQ